MINKNNNKKLKKRTSWNKGIKHSEETKEKMRGKIPWNKGLTKRTNSLVAQSAEKIKGHKVSEETRNKIGKANTGNLSWNKGLNGEEYLKHYKNGYPKCFLGKKHSEETKRKIGESSKGRVSPKKGRTYEELYGKEKAKRLIEIKKGRTYEELYGKEKAKKIRKLKKAIIPWNKGIKQWENKEHPRGMLGKKQTSKKFWEMMKLQVFPKKDTSIEIKIQDFLTSLKIEFITHKYMNIKHSYQCDILVPSLNLIIECDGDFFHMNPNKYSSEYQIFKKGMTAKQRWELDDSRTKELIEKGFKVLRLWEGDIRKMNIQQFQNKIREGI